LSLTPRPRPRRYPLIATVELTDLQSSAQLVQVISDLSLFGCHISTQHMWPIGSDVHINIVHNDEKFLARAKVVYGRPRLGMGVVFTHVEPAYQSVLDTWIAGLKNTMRGK
jgi:hypothetical protein